MTVRRRRSRPAPQELAQASRLWVLRIMVPLGGHRDLVGPMCFSNDHLARALGLGDWIDDDERDFDANLVKKRLRELHRQAENDLDRKVPAILHANVARLAALVGMSDIECRILEFATMLHHERILDDAAETLGNLSSPKIVDVLATLLDLQPDAVRDALGTGGVLARSGLLNIDRAISGSLRSKLDLLSNRFADSVVGLDADPISLLRDTVAPSAPARLTLGDFPHLEQELAILRPYLERTVSGSDTPRQGVNVFVYGAPGTGKSELARALAAELGCELFEVASEDEDGDPVGGERRLRAYRAAQSFFDRRRALLLFDEVEDVFADDGMFGQRSTAQRRKAWINRTLEQNRVPTLWLSNSIDGIDPAFLRRFDMLVEVQVPPRSQRERILQAACGDLVDAPTLARMARVETLAPAVVDRVASVVRTIRDQFDDAGAARAVAWLAGRTLEAQGHAGLDAGDAARLPSDYDPAILNADTDLAALLPGLQHARSGRLCLYGPPGTGKSAFGRWLAEQLEMPLMLRSASELMSKYVGDSEKAIAQAFRQAEREGALLMIDEVDSFLRDREGARASWEVTRVNEMLTRMEAFGGVFIASTNLMDDIDPAALRRFDLKLRFGYLRPEQGLLMLERQCAAFGLAGPGAHEQARMHGLLKLTPGDFAALARRHRFAPFTACAQLVTALEQECALKRGRQASIGFLA
ncbi:AAA family ATPase [Telluria beijingensis]|uniref:AAA family ATPase n=1 Tax=Telluria beijingensis TaxID=3068633 RepID=UPI002796352F|nr:ATP-binding protein [Massilia sp. REN29]